MRSAVLRAIEAVLLTPKVLWSGNPADYYKYLGDDVIEGQHEGFADPNKPLWLNLGYWETARRYPDAAAALATKLAEAADLGSGARLLDVGFGFAEQDLFWAGRYPRLHITGLNITPAQVQRGSERVARRGLAQRIELRTGSATEIPYPEASFDRLTALECAHHFDTRQRFFEEAYRVLRPGGVLATADGIRAPGGGKLSLLNKLALRRWCVPLPNVYDRDEYTRRLQDVGFCDVRVESIRNYVFPGVVKYQALRHKGVSQTDAEITLSQQEIDACAGLSLFEMTGLTDYVLARASKPR